MRKTKLIAAAALAAALTTTPATALAKPRLDKGFGLHHGYWVRADGPWASPLFLAAPTRGTVLVAGPDARFARIGADGKPDDGWGTGGAVDAVEGLRGPAPSPYSYAWANGAVRWNGRYLLTASGSLQTALVVDGRGRTLPVTDAVRAALPADVPGAGSTYLTELLVPGRGGRLWDLRATTSYATGRATYRTSLSLLDAAGAPLLQNRINLVNLPGDLATAIATGSQLVVIIRDWRAGRETVYRLLADGSFDTGFSAVRLPTGVEVAQTLPWQGGLVVSATDGRVLWISDTGKVVRRAKLPAGARVAFDSARRLVAVASHPSHHLVTVRRLRRDGRLDRAFGTVRLRATGRLVDAVGILASPGGRLLVVGSSLTENPAAVRDDYYIAHATVVWRLRTR
jgi:hypothetical protein